MNTQHHRNNPIHVASPRPHRCLRHHVWMAACDDCRREHSSRLSDRLTSADRRGGE